MKINFIHIFYLFFFLHDRVNSQIKVRTLVRFFEGATNGRNSDVIISSGTSSYQNAFGGTTRTYRVLDEGTTLTGSGGTSVNAIQVGQNVIDTTVERAASRGLIPSNAIEISTPAPMAVMTQVFPRPIFPEIGAGIRPSPYERALGLDELVVPAYWKFRESQDPFGILSIKQIPVPGQINIDRSTSPLSFQGVGVNDAMTTHVLAGGFLPDPVDFRVYTFQGPHTGWRAGNVRNYPDTQAIAQAEFAVSLMLGVTSSEELVNMFNNLITIFQGKSVKSCCNPETVAVGKYCWDYIGAFKIFTFGDSGCPCPEVNKCMFYKGDEYCQDCYTYEGNCLNKDKYTKFVSSGCYKSSEDTYECTETCQTTCDDYNVLWDVGKCCAICPIWHYNVGCIGSQVRTTDPNNFTYIITEPHNGTCTKCLTSCSHLGPVGYKILGQCKLNQDVTCVPCTNKPPFNAHYTSNQDLVFGEVCDNSIVKCSFNFTSPNFNVSDCFWACNPGTHWVFVTRSFLVPIVVNAWGRIGAKWETEYVLRCCTICTQTQYELKSCTLTDDTVCCTKCSSGQFELSPCTLSQDTRCCTSCKSDEYRQSLCTMEVDTVCCKNCPFGQIPVKECVPNSLAHCAPCPLLPNEILFLENEWVVNTCPKKCAEFFYREEIGFCCSKCNSTSFVKTKCTETTDSVCEFCTYPLYSTPVPNGIYCDFKCDAGYEKKLWNGIPYACCSPRPVDHYITRSCTPTQDALYAPKLTTCIPGYYKSDNVDINFFFKACTLCPGNSISTVNDAVNCTLCPSGYIADLFRTQCVLNCPWGSYAEDGVCKGCGLGEYITSMDGLGKPTCSYCQPNYYQDVPNSFSCNQCSTCPSGKFKFQDCNRESNTLCVDCPPVPTCSAHASLVGSCESIACVCNAGYYGDGLSCAQCTICSSVQYLACTSHTNTLCKCNAGYYFDGQQCTACASCSPPKSLLKTCDGTTRIDVSVCDCPAGQGYRSSIAQCVSCIYCGSNSVDLAPSRCIFDLIERNDLCACGPGYYQTEWDISYYGCTVCPKGKYKSDFSTGCYYCSPGKYASGTGQTECTTCPTGKYSLSSTYPKDACVNCLPGKFKVQGFDSGCEECPVGTYSVIHGNPTCDSCGLRNGYALTKDQAVCTLPETQVSCYDYLHFANTENITLFDCETGNIRSNLKQSNIEQTFTVNFKKTQKISIFLRSKNALSNLYVDIGTSGTVLTFYSCLEKTTACVVKTFNKTYESNAVISTDSYETFSFYSNFLVVKLSSVNGDSLFEFEYFAEDTPFRNCTSGFEVYDKACKPCMVGKYADAVSQSCVLCYFGKFQDDNITSSCKSCGPGYAQPALGQTYCLTCSPGSYSQGLQPVSCLMCEPGKFQSSAASSHCFACSAGTYATSTQATSCSNCTICKQFEYVFLPCTTERNTICGCNDGYIGDGSTCNPCGYGELDSRYYDGQYYCLSCQPGKYATGFAQTNCDICPMGTYAVNYKSTACASCSRGKYWCYDKLTTSGNSSCSRGEIRRFNYGDNEDETFIIKLESNTFINFKWIFYYNDNVYFNTESYHDYLKIYNCEEMEPICLLGSYSGRLEFLSRNKEFKFTNKVLVLKWTSDFSNTNTGWGLEWYSDQNTCIDCASGTYTYSTGKTTCVPLTDVLKCTSGNAFDGTNCLPCQPGTYRSYLGLGAACTMCDMCWPCEPGTFENTTGSSQCKQCQPGKTSNYYSTSCYDIVCNPGFFKNITFCSPCPAGTYTVSNNTFISCNLCPPGKYQDLNQQTSCKSCEPETYQAINGSSYCFLCPAGKASSAYESNFCDDTPCFPGFFKNVSTCSPCPLGGYTFKNNTQSVCSTCENGKFQNLQQQTFCKTCQACFQNMISKACSPETDTVCGDCPVNYGGNGINCTLCDLNTEPIRNITSNELICTICPIGKYFKIDTGLYRCLFCDLGTYQSSLAQSFCSSCTPGQYQNAYGSTFCKTCDIGKYALNSGASACQFFDTSTTTKFVTSSVVTTITSSSSTTTTTLPLTTSTTTSTTPAPTTTTGPLVCSKGYFLNYSVCDKCAPGTYNDYQGVNTSCSLCAPGFFSDYYGAESCAYCENNLYNTASGVSFCRACTIYQYPCYANLSRGTTSYCPNGRVVHKSSGAAESVMWYMIPFTNSSLGTVTFKITNTPTTAADSGSISLHGYSPKRCAGPTFICFLGSYNFLGYSSATFVLDGMGSFNMTFLLQVYRGIDVQFTFEYSTGLKSCAACPVGSLSLKGDGSQCDTCVYGYYSSNSKCAPCAPGYFSDYYDAQACTACDKGLYNTAFGATVCSKCALGKFSSLNGSTTESECQSCEPSTYGASDISHNFCLSCSAGKYQTGLGMTSESACQVCLPGTFSSPMSGSLANCLACQAGTYSSSSASTECTLCSVNQYNDKTNRSACQACPVNKFSDFPFVNCTGCSIYQYPCYANLSRETTSYCPNGMVIHKTSGAAETVKWYMIPFTNNSLGTITFKIANTPSTTFDTGAIALYGYSPNRCGYTNPVCFLGNYNFYGTSSVTFVFNQVGSFNLTFDLQTYRGYDVQFTLEWNTAPKSCAPCPIGLMSLKEDGPFCDTCAYGYYSSQSKCLPCPAGTYCPFNSTPVTCNNLRWGNVLAQSTFESGCNNLCVACPSGTVRVNCSGSSAGVCAPCPANFYGGGFACSQCPLGSTSQSSSPDIEDCQCAGQNQIYQGSCSPCLANMSKLGQKCVCDEHFYGTFPLPCQRCPANSYSPKNTTQRLGCICNDNFQSPLCDRCFLGYYLLNSQCLPCEAGTFCPDGLSRADCPVNFWGTSQAQSTSASACPNPCGTCDLGQYKSSCQGSSEGTCLPCPSDTYGGGAGFTTPCTACPILSTSPQGSTTFDACECQGDYQMHQSVCQPCMQNMVKLGRYCVCAEDYYGYFPLGCSPCQPNSDSLVNSTKGSECVCRPNFQAPYCSICVLGYYLSNQACVECPQGYYCLDGRNATQCPANTWGNLTGKGTPSSACPYSCEPCLPGYERQGCAVDQPGACSVCPANFYGDGSGPCLPCKPGSVSPQGSQSSQDCLCPVNYDDVGSQCVPCPDNSVTLNGRCVCRQNYYGTSVEGCSPCPGRVNSPANTTTLDQCVCSNGWRAPNCAICALGYYFSFWDQDCFLCYSGHFCLDGTNAEMCPEGTYQPYEGQSSCLNCTLCSPGYVRQNCFLDQEGTCQPCPSNTYGRGIGTLEDNCVSCPEGLVSQPGSGYEEDCICPGNAQVIEGVCVACPANTVKLKRKCVCQANYYGTFEQGCTPCSDRATSPINSTSVDGCVCGNFWKSPLCDVCIPGYYFLSYWPDCLECWRGYYCPNGIDELECPADTYTAGFGQSACNPCAPCPPGSGRLFCGRSDSGICQQCPGNTYGGTGNYYATCKTCPGGTNSPAGSTTIYGCECPDNYQITEAGCMQCLENMVKVGTRCVCVEDFHGSFENNCSRCPVNSTSVLGSVNVSDCKCIGNLTLVNGSCVVVLVTTSTTTRLTTTSTSLAPTTSTSTSLAPTTSTTTSLAQTTSTSTSLAPTTSTTTSLAPTTSTSTSLAPTTSTTTSLAPTTSTSTSLAPTTSTTTSLPPTTSTSTSLAPTTSTTTSLATTTLVTTSLTTSTTSLTTSTTSLTTSTTSLSTTTTLTTTTTAVITTTTRAPLCTPGSYENGVECVTCPEGYFCPDGRDIFECGGGMWGNTSNQSSYYASCTIPCGGCPVSEWRSFCSANFEGICAPCPANTYGGGPAFFTPCTPCPVNGTSLPGSSSIEQCQCPSHMWLVSGNCSFCPANMTLVDNVCVCNPNYHGSFLMGCLPCPANSDSPMNSLTILQCVCRANFYRDSNLCPACPSNSTSLPASLSITACKCVANFYSNSNQCLKCPAFSLGPAGSSSISSCTCIPGYNREEPYLCSPCPAGYVCPSQYVVNLCPDNLWGNLTGQHEISKACPFPCGTCPLGQYNIRCGAFNPGVCRECEAGQYGGGQGAVSSAWCQTCPTGSTSQRGSGSATDCACKQNFYGSPGLFCWPCPSNSLGVFGATDVFGCVCNANFYGPDQFAQCAACPLHSTSPKGSRLSQNCTCVPGFYGPNGGTCEPCPPLWTCPGGNESLPPYFSRTLMGISACCDVTSTFPGSPAVNFYPVSFKLTSVSLNYDDGFVYSLPISSPNLTFRYDAAYLSLNSSTFFVLNIRTYPSTLLATNVTVVVNGAFTSTITVTIPDVTELMLQTYFPEGLDPSKRELRRFQCSDQYQWLEVTCKARVNLPAILPISSKCNLFVRNPAIAKVFGDTIVGVSPGTTSAYAVWWGRQAEIPSFDVLDESVEFSELSGTDYLFYGVSGERKPIFLGIVQTLANGVSTQTIPNAFNSEFAKLIQVSLPVSGSVIRQGNFLISQLNSMHLETVFFSLPPCNGKQLTYNSTLLVNLLPAPGDLDAGHVQGVAITPDMLTVSLRFNLDGVLGFHSEFGCDFQITDCVPSPLFSGESACTVFDPTGAVRVAGINRGQSGIVEVAILFVEGTPGGLQGWIQTTKGFTSIIAGKWGPGSMNPDPFFPAFPLLDINSVYRANGENLLVLVNQQRLLVNSVIFASDRELSVLIRLVNRMDIPSTDRVRAYYHVNSTVDLPYPTWHQVQHLRDGWYGIEFKGVVSPGWAKISILIETLDDRGVTGQSRRRVYGTIPITPYHALNLSGLDFAHLRLGEHFSSCPREAETPGQVTVTYKIEVKGEPKLPFLELSNSLGCLIGVARRRVDITYSPSLLYVQVTVESFLRLYEVNLFVLNETNMGEWLGKAGLTFVEMRRKWQEFSRDSPDLPSECPHGKYYYRGQYVTLPPHSVPLNCYSFTCERGYHLIDQWCARNDAEEQVYWNVLALLCLLIFFSGLLALIIKQVITNLFTKTPPTQPKEEDPFLLPVDVTEHGDLVFAAEVVEQRSCHSCYGKFEGCPCSIERPEHACCCRMERGEDCHCCCCFMFNPNADSSEEEPPQYGNSFGSG